MTLMYKGHVAFLGIVCFLVEEIAQSTVREPEWRGLTITIDCL